MQHSPRFLQLIEQLRAGVKETDVNQVYLWQQQRQHFVLVDVREESEWQRGHLPGAVYLGKGIIERDIEVRYPDTDTPLVLYCGGGYRSVIAADLLQKMGYTNVISMDGGFRGWTQAGYPVVLPQV